MIILLGLCADTPYNNMYFHIYTSIYYGIVYDGIFIEGQREPFNVIINYSPKSIEIVDIDIQ